MSYCTSADLIARFSETEIAQLSDTEDRETVNEAVVSAAITDAAGEIDSYLGGRYAVPVASPDARLAAVCMDIARYRLYDDHPTETVRQRYEDVVAWLKLVATGAIRLAFPAPAEDSTIATGGLAYSVPADDTDNPTFTRLVW
jgi:phage gp36-like protein